MKKTSLILLVLSIYCAPICIAQDSQIQHVQEFIYAYASAGDKNETKKLATYLDDNFRIVMNRLFGSESVAIMDKNTYLQKIESKEYGGDKRELSIENVVINNTTASAKVIFRGTKITFVSILILVQSKDGNWKIISDLPTIPS